ncbi:hypothetical protein [Hypericibacter terrae]|uniref:hypothetical protein n=1 Tax=Hypericibacter terrae TaxID=2602015 RepID=UPI0017850415|nr:hypothetical protein [Hypericibacter terrae]
MLLSTLSMLFWGLVSSWAEFSSVVGPASLDFAGVVVFVGSLDIRSFDAAIAWSEIPTPMVNAITKAKLRTKAPPLQRRLMTEKRDGKSGLGSAKTGVGRRLHRRVSRAPLSSSLPTPGATKKYLLRQ